MTSEIDFKHVRVERTSFPDPPGEGSKLIPGTISNLAYILETAGLSPRYNVIRKSVDLVTATGAKVAMAEVISLAMLNGYPTGHVYEFVGALAERNPVNPIRDWIDSKLWDTTDRLPELYACVKTVPEYPTSLKEVLLRKWFLSAAAAAVLDSGFRSRGVLTLQGPQGIGKTRFIASILPKGRLRDDYLKLDHHMDGASKDSILGAIKAYICEIGELDSSFKKDIARLKGFLTNDCDKLRRPYGREEAEFPRRTVFAATVNEDCFLQDVTGNSRWWTLALERIDWKHEIDTQQLFAQLAAKVRAGEAWWLSDAEDEQLAEWNKRHRSEGATWERVRDWIEQQPASKARNFTAIEVLKAAGINYPSNPQCKECSQVLRELYGEPKRVTGRYRWKIEFHGASPGIDHTEIYD